MRRRKCCCASNAMIARQKLRCLRWKAGTPCPRFFLLLSRSCPQLPKNRPPGQGERTSARISLPSNWRRRYPASIEAAPLMEEAAPIALPDQVELDLEPERFDPALLTQPPAVRVASFEKECTIEHRSLLQARDAVLRTICSPGEGSSLNRLA